MAGVAKANNAATITATTVRNDLVRVITLPPLNRLQEKYYLQHI
jgi:hypothetical protein